ncbi:hypothetical protein DFR52_103427 [Hoeflea marina]|uniref:EamA domain-containing protein n=1 Tax=Hoeflea marina TaxID=274592 RepID=A0A317PKN2_9HYPH|nr:hypothetical protein [Hoeflea marina]PWW00225.1 hypothetical protein DFR52_103427 [Hoeflea marina]
MSRLELVLCLICAVSITAGQIMLKFAAKEMLNTRSYLDLATSPLIYASFAVYGLAMVLWLYILTRVPLSLAYPFVIMGSGLVFVFAFLIFGEVLTNRQYIGLVIMLVGTIVVYA